MNPSADSTPTSTDPPASRRGRPAVGTETERRDHVLDAALEVLVAGGVDRLTMAAVAKQAGASKQTLYRWFGDRLGLFEALIRRNADRSADRLGAELAAGDNAPTVDEVRKTLTSYAVGLLRLLTSESSIALNRAAMSDADLRRLLLQQGRHRIGPIVERYLALAHDANVIRYESVGGPAGAFTLLYGLVVRDTQIRVLLGESSPSARALDARAEQAVRQFLDLCRISQTAPVEPALARTTGAGQPY